MMVIRLFWSGKLIMKRGGFYGRHAFLFRWRQMLGQAGQAAVCQGNSF
jgi:hypothetical protein